MSNPTLGVIFGNRDFFPDQLVTKQDQIFRNFSKVLILTLFYLMKKKPNLAE